MLLYYITDRSQFPGDEDSRRSRLLATLRQADVCGVDYIQLREKDLSPHDLETLVRDVRRLRTGNHELKTALLINSRTDVALACGANGVHLRSGDISPIEVREIYAKVSAGAAARLTVGISCHTRDEVACAAKEGADFAVFGPVFEKPGMEKATTRLAGLGELREACQERIPVLALGGITIKNAASCMKAGAAGIAGIRLFQENEMGSVVAALRRLEEAAGRPAPRLSQSRR